MRERVMSNTERTPPTRTLEVSRLSSGYGGSFVINKVSFAIGRGEILALLGKNGMGKTTLARTILGFLRPREGTIIVGGREMTGSTPNVMAHNGVAHIPQEKAIFQDLSVRDNLRLATTNDRTFRDNLDRVFSIFPFFEQRLKQKAGTLSGGEQKMLMIVRAIMLRPRLMLIDEVSEGVQPSVIERIAEVLRRERDGNGTAMLLIEQNIAFALAVADRWAVLKRGEIDDAGSVGSNAAAIIADHLSI
jgi:urea transport system ATP-binding protein